MTYRKSVYRCASVTVGKVRFREVDLDHRKKCKNFKILVGLKKLIGKSVKILKFLLG